MLEKGRQSSREGTMLYKQGGIKCMSFQKTTTEIWGMTAMAWGAL